MDGTRGCFFAAVAVVCLLCTGSGLFADNPVSMDAYLGFNGAFQMSGGVPVRIRVRNDGPGLSGDLFIETVDQNGEIIRRSTRAVELPGGSKKEIAFTLFPGSISDRLSMGLINGGREIFRKRIDFGRRWYTKPLVLAVGRAGSFDFLLQCPPITDAGYPLVHIHPEDLPVSFFDYAGVRLLILHDIPPGDIDPSRAEALAQWVDSGGILVLSYGNDPGYLSGRETPLHDLLPVSLTGLGVLRRLDILLPGGEEFSLEGPVPVVRTSPPGEGPIRAGYGEGSVIFLPFDSTPGFLSIEQALVFWQSVLTEPMKKLIRGPGLSDFEGYPLVVLREEVEGFPGRLKALLAAVVLSVLLGVLLRVVFLHPGTFRLAVVLFSGYSLAAVLFMLLLFYYPGRGPGPVMASFSFLEGTSRRSNATVRTETVLYAPALESADFRLPPFGMPVSGNKPLLMRHLGGSILEGIRLDHWKQTRFATQLEVPMPLGFGSDGLEVEIENRSPWMMDDLYIVTGGVLLEAGTLMPGERRTIILDTAKGVPPASGLFGPVRRRIMEEAFKDPGFSALMKGSTPLCIGWIDGRPLSGEPEGGGWEVFSHCLLAVSLTGGESR